MSSLSNYRLIRKEDYDRIMLSLKRARHRCENAMTVDLLDPEQEELASEYSYPAATGYANGTIYHTLMTLEYTIDGAILVNEGVEEQRQPSSSLEPCTSEVSSVFAVST